MKNLLFVASLIVSIPFLLSCNVDDNADNAYVSSRNAPNQNEADGDTRWIQLTEVLPYPEWYDPNDYEDFTDEDLVTGPPEDRVGDAKHRKYVTAELGSVKVVRDFRGPAGGTTSGDTLTVFRNGTQVYRTRALTVQDNHVIISPTTDDIWVVATGNRPDTSCRVGYIYNIGHQRTDIFVQTDKANIVQRDKDSNVWESERIKCKASEEIPPYTPDEWKITDDGLFKKKTT